MKVLVATSDKTSHILTAFEYLMDKYCPELIDIEILGYGVFPKLGEKYNIISLHSHQKSINEWCERLHKHITTLPDEYVIFGLEDLLPVRPINYKTFNLGFELMQLNSSVGRYELGTGHCWHSNTSELNGTPFYLYGSESLYRISTQWAIWRREYLLEYLRNAWSAWDFEIEGSRIASIDGRDVICSYKDHAWHWVHSALSGKYPDMVNVIDIDRKDVEDMIAIGILQRDKLQLGIDLNSPRYE